MRARATAEHTDIVVEAHVERPLLVLILADQPRVQITAEHLSDLVNADLGVVLCTALNLLGFLAQRAPRSPDVVQGFQVPALYT